jgi:hypothetical protein
MRLISKFEPITEKYLLIDKVSTSSDFSISQDNTKAVPKSKWNPGLITIRYSDGSVYEYFVEGDYWDCDGEIAQLLPPPGSIIIVDPLTRSNVVPIFNRIGILGDGDFDVVFGPLPRILLELRTVLFSNMAFMLDKYSDRDPRISHVRAYLRCCQVADINGLSSFRRSIVPNFGAADNLIKTLELPNCRDLGRLEAVSNLLDPIIQQSISAIAKDNDSFTLLKTCDKAININPQLSNILRAICILFISPRIQGA